MSVALAKSALCGVLRSFSVGQSVFVFHRCHRHLATRARQTEWEKTTLPRCICLMQEAGTDLAARLTCSSAKGVRIGTDIKLTLEPRLKPRGRQSLVAVAWSTGRSTWRGQLAGSNVIALHATGRLANAVYRRGDGGRANPPLCHSRCRDPQGRMVVTSSRWLRGRVLRMHETIPTRLFRAGPLCRQIGAAAGRSSSSSVWERGRCKHGVPTVCTALAAAERPSATHSYS